MKKIDTLIIVLAYNEAKNILSVIDDLKQSKIKADILVINDGSSDETVTVLNGQNDITILQHIYNIGIGASFETGCLYALSRGYEYIVRIDGDGQHSASYIDSLLLPLKQNQLDITIGSRFLGNSEFKSSFFRIIGILVISSILTFMFRKKITDPTSGFCAMNKKAYSFFSKNCAEDYPEPEIFIYRNRFRIGEIPINIGKRQAGVSSITPLKSLYYMMKVILALTVRWIGKEKQ